MGRGRLGAVVQVRVQQGEALWPCSAADTARTHIYPCLDSALPPRIAGMLGSATLPGVGLCLPSRWCSCAAVGSSHASCQAERTRDNKGGACTSYDSADKEKRKVVKDAPRKESDCKKVQPHMRSREGRGLWWERVGRWADW